MDTGIAHFLIYSQPAQLHVVELNILNQEAGLMCMY